MSLSLSKITFVLLVSLLSIKFDVGFVLVYAPGVTMTQETYRFAYEEANAELREILGQFDLLQARKAQIEQVVEALKALLVEGPMAEIIAAPAAEAAPYLVQQAVEASAEAKPDVAQEMFPEPTLQPDPAFNADNAEPAYAGEQSSDPFQRRIDNALRHGLGSRESRILPRALNGLLSRA